MGWTRWSAVVSAVIVAAMPAMSVGQSLDQVLSGALASNPTLHSADLSALAAEADVELAGADALPRLDLSLNGKLDWSASGTLTSTKTMSLGLDYSHTLFDSGRTAARVEAANASTIATRHRADEIEQQVLGSVVSAYFGVLRDRQLIEIRRDSAQFYAEQVSNVKALMAADGGTRIELAQAQARSAQAEAALRQAELALQTSSASFVRWAGREPGRLTFPKRSATHLPKSLQHAWELADRAHPALLSARANATAAEFAADAAVANFGPTLQFSSSVCAIQCGSVSQPTSLAGSMQLVLKVPLYSGGRTGAESRKANLVLIKSEFDGLSRRDEIREALTVAWAEVGDADAQIAAAQTSVAVSEEILDSLLVLRDAGTETTLAVLDAQIELVEARERLLFARVKAGVAVYALLAGTGLLSSEGLGLKPRPQVDVAANDSWNGLR